MKWWSIARLWQRQIPTFAAWSHADGLPLSGAYAGDNYAELELALPQHIPAMLRTATALVGRAQAEDATQEAILRAWQARSSLREREALRAWLLRITINVCRQWQRNVGERQMRLMEPLPDDDNATLATFADDPGANHHTSSIDLRTALNALRDDKRLLIVLRYYADMDIAELSHVLGIPERTVRTRLRRALIALRTQLSDPTALETLSEQEGEES
jgi:RNA polymerase sigma factor (sigma-70 family)